MLYVPYRRRNFLFHTVRRESLYNTGKQALVLDKEEGDEHDGEYAHAGICHDRCKRAYPVAELAKVKDIAELLDKNLLKFESRGKVELVDKETVDVSKARGDGSERCSAGKGADFPHDFAD